MQTSNNKSGRKEYFPEIINPLTKKECLKIFLRTFAEGAKILSPEQIQGLRMSAKNYVLNAQRFQSGLKKIV
jgi:hypothetical protein